MFITVLLLGILLLGLVLLATGVVLLIKAENKILGALTAAIGLVFFGACLVPVLACQ